MYRPKTAQDYTEEQKRQFALALCRFPDDEFKAALQVFPGNPGVAYELLQALAHDADVMATRDALLDEHGEDAFLPGAAELAREIWRVGKGDAGYADAKDRVAAFKLYAEVRGFTGESSKGNTYVNNGGVMVVKDHGTDEQWKQQLAAQQKRLISEAAAG